MSGRDPARLLLVRHGQTVWHAENRYAGSSDVGLNERGRAEARALVRRAVAEAPDAVVCSPLSRAVETARAAAEACGVKLRIEDRLREVHFGEWEGRMLAEVRETDPEGVRRFVEDPVAHGFPGGEPLPEAARRACEALRDLDREYPGGKVLIVAHSTLIRVALCGLLGVPLRDYRRRFPKMVNVAITEVRLRGGGALGGALYTFNDAGHLEEA